MDMRTGEIHPSKEAADAAGVPAEQQIPVLPYYPGPNRCGTCGKKINGSRRCTPKKNDAQGRPWAWCKRCWFKRGVAHE